MGPDMEGQDRMTPIRLVSAAVAKLRKNVEVLLLAIVAIIAVAPFGRLYADQHHLVLAGGAVVVAALVSLIVSPRLPLPAAIGIAAVSSFLYMGVTVFHTLRPAPIWDGITQSWSTLLTASLPAVSTSTFVALPVALAAVATSVATEIALRTRWKVGPVLAPIGVLVVALLFTGKRPLPSPVLMASMILLILLIVFVRAHKSTGSAGELDPTGINLRRGAAFGLPTIVAIAVVATGLGAVLPITSSSHRVDLRERYNPPVQIAQGITPLALLQSQLNSPSTTPVFTVRFRGIPAGVKIDRVPVAILDTYDGAVWGTNASFALAGNQLPTGLSPVQPGPTIHQDYRVGAYGLSFLPALGRPIRTAGNHLAFDRVSGMLATPTPAPAGFKYSVDSELPDQSGVASAPVKPGNDPSFALLALAPPQGWPKAITDFASKFSAKTPYATLQLMADELRSRDFGYNKTARPGHSLGLLSAFLTAPATNSQVTTARVGFDEQFAAAFAVLARAKGFPSEVVVGYRVDPVAAAKGIPIAVLPRQIHAWVEVNLNGVGWVTFDPTNTTPRNSTVPSAPPPAPPPPPVPVVTGSSGHNNHNAVVRAAQPLEWLLVGLSPDWRGHRLPHGSRRNQDSPAAPAGPPRHTDRAGGRSLARRTRKSPVARRPHLPGHDGRRRRPTSPRGDRRRRRHAGQSVRAGAECRAVRPVRAR